ncbi:MAG: hypothetical protein WC551_00675 [Patescibacteria group bacterium]
MPESVLFEKILPGKNLTREEWLSLIDERARLIRLFMDRVRLTKLSDFGYAPSDFGGGCTVSINGLRDKRTVIQPGDDIHVEGIFRSVTRRSKEDRLGRWYHVLGLTRAGDWRLAEILEGTDGCMGFIKSIDILPTGPLEAVRHFRIEYRDILSFLADEYNGWVEKKREIFERMQRVQAKFAVDDRIIDALSAEPKEQGR